MRITKIRVAGAAIVAALAIPTAAAAVFSDVPPGAFYAAPVAWAAENGITQGKTPTQFAPNDAVTRGEVVTFLKRYHDNLVAPALGTIEMTHGTNDLVALATDAPTTVDHLLDGTEVSGDGVVLASISGPASFGETGYELTSLEVCIGSVTIGGQLTRIEVWEGGDGTDQIADVALDLRVQGCTTIPVGAAVDSGIGVAFHVGADAFESLRITGLTSTWQAVG